MNKVLAQIISGVIPIKTYRRRFRSWLLKQPSNAGACHFSPNQHPLPYRIDPRFFSKKFEDDEKRSLFRDNVQYIILETHSFCNRKCWFCPNFYIDRHSEMIRMEDKLFRKILSELVEVDYRGDISFAFYNEPLADKQFPEQIALARKLLPNTPMHINTNGDYLSPSLLHSLYLSGMSRVLISVYIDDKQPGSFSYSKAKDAVLAMRNKLELEGEIIEEPNDVHCNFITRYKKSFNHPGMYVLIHAENHSIMTNYRGGAIPEDENVPVPRANTRDYTCIAPFVQVMINFDGRVMPCSDLRPDFSGHSEYIAGDLNNATIYDIFCDEIYTEFRKQLILDGNNLLPCRYCVDNILKSPHHVFVEAL